MTGGALTRILLLVLLGAGGLMIRSQSLALSHLEQANQQWVAQNTELMARLSAMKKQAAAVSAALAVRTQQYHQQENSHYALRHQIQDLLVQNVCARQSVPAAVIRLQRDALDVRAVSD